MAKTREGWVVTDGDGDFRMGSYGATAGQAKALYMLTYCNGASEEIWAGLSAEGFALQRVVITPIGESVAGISHVTAALEKRQSAH